jgi:hypothetical protein
MLLAGSTASVPGYGLPIFSAMRWTVTVLSSLIAQAHKTISKRTVYKTQVSYKKKAALATTKQKEEKEKKPKPEEHEGKPKHNHCPHARHRGDMNPKYHEEQHKDVA